jgi:hypothetical protein
MFSLPAKRRGCQNMKKLIPNQKAIYEVLMEMIKKGKFVIPPKDCRDSPKTSEKLKPLFLSR